jgi:hypothetical protein
MKKFDTFFELLREANDIRCQEWMGHKTRMINGGIEWRS